MHIFSIKPIIACLHKSDSFKDIILMMETIANMTPMILIMEATMQISMPNPPNNFETDIIKIDMMAHFQLVFPAFL